MRYLGIDCHNINQSLYENIIEVTELANTAKFKDTPFSQYSLDLMRRIYANQLDSIWIKDLQEIKEFLYCLQDYPKYKSNARKLKMSARRFIEFIDALIASTKSKGKSTIILRQEGIDCRAFLYRGECALNPHNDRYYDGYNALDPHKERHYDANNAN